MPSPRTSPTGVDTLTVTDDPPEEKQFTADELLEMVLAAYERGLTDARAEQTRDFWHSPAVEQIKKARQLSEARTMKHRARARYEARGYPYGYDYRGGPVNWETGLPQGSGCAWLRVQRMFDLAGGEQ